MNGKIDLFIFDEGGVMIRDFYVLPAMAAKLGIDEKELTTAFKPDLGDFSRGKISTAELWRHFSEHWNIQVPEDYFATLFDPKPEPGSFELVAELAQRYRVVCGTNTIKSHHEINGKRGFYNGFHAVYASHLMGKAKPEPDFWTAILAIEKVAPDRAFFIDDSSVNVEAARSLGLQAWLFKGADSLRLYLTSIGILDQA